MDSKVVKARLLVREVLDNMGPVSGELGRDAREDCRLRVAHQLREALKLDWEGEEARKQAIGRVEKALKLQEEYDSARLAEAVELVKDWKRIRHEPSRAESWRFCGRESGEGFVKVAFRGPGVT